MPLLVENVPAYIVDPGRAVNAHLTVIAAAKRAYDAANLAAENARGTNNEKEAMDIARAAWFEFLAVGGKAHEPRRRGHREAELVAREWAEAKARADAASANEQDDAISAARVAYGNYLVEASRPSAAIGGRRRSMRRRSSRRTNTKKSLKNKKRQTRRH